MILFLLTFLSLYGGIHVYAWLRLASAFPAAPKTLLMLFMAVMTLSPLAVRVVEHRGQDLAARCIAWPSYVWMGFLFLFVSFLAGADLIRLCIALLPGNMFTLPAAGTCRAVLLLAVAASFYSFHEARSIRTEHLTILTDRLPAGSRAVRIAQISDVHIGLLFREKRLASVLHAVQEASPDILISTGDLVDGRLSREEALSGLNILAGMIERIPTPRGKFAVTGNHESYAGIDQALAFTRQAGFTVLRNGALPLADGITLIGIDDPGMRQHDSAAARERSLLSAPLPGFRILLKHRPWATESTDGRFDLQLSGHTHKGQLLPFYPLTWLEFPQRAGTSRTQGGSTIHVSRGSGTWGPPMRFLAPPEVTVIDIVPNRPAPSP